jgi:hypothetical protein
MGKLPKKLQDEIQVTLYMLIAGVRLRASNTGGSHDKEWQAYLRGKIEGIEAAKMVIDAWNEPNHGLVKPQLNKG